MENKTMNIAVVDEREVLGKKFRIYGDFENPLFLAKDVAEWIDYAKTGKGVYDVSKMLQGVDEEEKLVRTIFVSGQNREVSMLTEDGLYEVLMQSRKPIAKQFKKKVKEILKEIRQTGSYITDNDNARVNAADKVITGLEDEDALALIIQLAQDKKKLLIENRVMKPKAEYFDALVDRNLLTNFRDTAKELKMKQKQFIDRLLDDGYVYRDVKGRLKPYAEHTPSLFEMKEYKSGEYTGVQTLVTPRGRETFRMLYTNKMS